MQFSLYNVLHIKNYKVFGQTYMIHQRLDRNNRSRNPIPEKFYTHSQKTSSLNCTTFIWRSTVQGMSCAFFIGNTFPSLKLIMTNTA